MTAKVITYAVYALDRMHQREVTRPMVRTVLAVGLWERGRGERQSKRAYIGRRELRVIYFESAREIHVMNAFFTDRKPAHERVGYRGE